MVFSPQHFSLLWYGIIILLTGCKNDPVSNQQPSLPNTPETVSRQWQVFLDNNQIDKAVQLSTPKTTSWLRENEQLFLSDPQTYQTNFLQMKCEETGNRATCHYQLKEEGEIIDDYFLLKKINGQWLVDLEDDEGNPESEEALFREMQKELNLAQ